MNDIMGGRYTVEDIQRASVADRSHEFFETGLEYGYGSRDCPEDGEPYWKVSWSSNVYWTSSEPDGSTFEEVETTGYEAFYFRDQISAIEWTKFLKAWDSTMDIDEPRFVCTF